MVREGLRLQIKIVRYKVTPTTGNSFLRSRRVSVRTRQSRHPVWTPREGVRRAPQLYRTTGGAGEDQDSLRWLKQREPVVCVRVRVFLFFFMCEWERISVCLFVRFTGVVSALRCIPFVCCSSLPLFFRSFSKVYESWVCRSIFLLLGWESLSTLGVASHHVSITLFFVFSYGSSLTVFGSLGYVIDHSG